MIFYQVITMCLLSSLGVGVAEQLKCLLVPSKVGV